MYQTNSGKSPKFVSTSTFIFCSPLCSNNCGVVFFVKIYFSFREMTFFVRPLKYANFHREYYPSCVTSCSECTRPTVFFQLEQRTTTFIDRIWRAGLLTFTFLNKFQQLTTLKQLRQNTDKTAKCNRMFLLHQRIKSDLS